MQIVQAPRASAILYNLLIARADRRPWLLPANICPIVPITFLKACIPFELVDISAATLNIDLEQAEARVGTRRYGGLLYAHTYGEPSTPADFFATVRSIDPDLLIVDDRCLCAPELDPESVSQADVSLYSTGYAKFVELNFGGYAFIKQGIAYHAVRLSFEPADLAELERSYKQSVQRGSRFEYHDSGWLEASTDIPAWYDYRRRIESGLAASSARRAELNEIYASRLPLDIQLPAAYQTWRFNIRVKNKVRLLQSIFEAGLFASSHYASLASIMAEGRAPQAEKLAEEIINLFNDHHFDAERAARICDLIREHYEG